ncbi:MAG: Gfo/Idh/MocA family protein [Nitrospinaceae bacterium]
MAADTIKIGFIGAGQNSRKMHIPKLQALPGVEIVKVANRTLDSGQKVAREFGIPAVCGDWKQVATSRDVDAVVIGTWPYLHCDAACLALESGKHVLCEARMAMNAHEAQKMLRVSLKHPHLVSQLVPAPFTFRVDSTLDGLIGNGDLGRLLYFHIDYQSAALAPSGEALHWRRNKKYSGVNTMVLGILYESLRRWLPPAQWVSAVGQVFNDTTIDPETGEPVTIEVPDYLSVQMELKSGILGSFLISERGLFAGTPMVKIFGDRGTVQCEFAPNGKLWYGSRSGGKLEEIRIPRKKENHWRVEEEFINTIRGKEKIKFTPFATGVEYMKFTEAVITSWQNGGARIGLEPWK